MVTIPVRCPHCHSSEVIKAGKQANGTQRYRCQNGRCARRIFLPHYCPIKFRLTDKVFISVAERQHE